MSKQVKEKTNEEKKVNVTISIRRSIIDKVRYKINYFGGKVSPLIENLLVIWLEEHDNIESKNTMDGRIKKLKK